MLENHCCEACWRKRSHHRQTHRQTHTQTHAHTVRARTHKHIVCTRALTYCAFPYAHARLSTPMFTRTRTHPHACSCLFSLLALFTLSQAKKAWRHEGSSHEGSGLRKPEDHEILGQDRARRGGAREHRDTTECDTKCCETLLSPFDKVVLEQSRHADL